MMIIVSIFMQELTGFQGSPAKLDFLTKMKEKNINSKKANSMISSGY